jgi:DHA2 family multidrug resistance protein
MRNFAFGCIALSVGFAIFFGNNLLMPLWLQTQMGYMATWAGLVAAPSGVVAVIMTPFVARIVGKVDARLTASISLAAFAFSFYLRSNYAPDADFLELVIPMLVMGFGMSGFFISMVTICLNGVPPQQVPQATGLSNFARITAGSFAASITTTLWGNSEAQHQTRIAESTGAPGNPIWTHAMEVLQHQGASASQAAAGLMQQVLHQAYFLATVDLFRMSAWITLALIPLVWLTTKAVSGGGGAHAAGE